MTNTTKKTRLGHQCNRGATIPIRPTRNPRTSRKQRLYAFRERAVRAKLLAYRKSSRRAGGGAPRHELEPLEVHALAKLPEMSAKEYADLRDDIASNGVMEAIVLYEGKILDGYHRSKACCELGIPRKTVIYKGSDPAGYVLSRNAYRRHLSADQRTALITKLRGPQLKAEAQARIKTHQFGAGSTRENTAALKSAGPGRLDEQIAKESGVGRDKARKAVRLLETKPEVLDEVITAKRQRLPAAPAKPRKPKPPVNKLDPIYVNRRFGLILKHWPSHADQRKVRNIVKESLT